MERNQDGAWLILIVAVWLLSGGQITAQASDPPLPRDLHLPLPLFDQVGSAWLQDARSAAVLGESDQQVLVTYRVLCGDTTDLYPATDTPYTTWPYPDINYDEYTMPIFAAGDGQQSVLLCDYEGNQSYPGTKWPMNELGGPVTVPTCAGTVRPASPLGADSDGHLILYDADSATAYDFWQATTLRSGVCESHGGGLEGDSIPEAGYADYFDIHGDGSNPDDEASARAMGTALLAGMILPEDIESGEIGHALALAIPGPRNLSPDPYEPLSSDYYYPAATTETDYFSTSPAALAAGQRLRMKSQLVDEDGDLIDESELAPITQMFIAALRRYGAYVVDNAGGFSFYAEDIHTAVLHMSEAETNSLIGEPSGTPLPDSATKWQLVIETLNEELWELPFASGICAGGSSSVYTANFEVVEPALAPGSCIPASITSQPQDATVSSGTSVTLAIALTGSEPVSIQWYQGASGDLSNPIGGATSADYTTPQLYASTSFWVRISNGCGSSDSDTASVTVTTAADWAFRYLIPAVAHNPGAAGTLWRTDVAAVNPTNAAASIKLTFYPAAGGDLLIRAVPLAAGAATEWVNIIETVFQQAAGANLSGSISIESTRALLVSARTYNQTVTGTYGQYLPACTEALALGLETVGYLPQIKSNDAYRTNLGVVNIGDASVTVEVRVHDQDGNQIGSSKHVTTAARRWKQVNDIFAAVGAGDEDVAYATIMVTSGSGQVWVYASVVDNKTGDGTSIPLLVLAQ
jgi:hypothetical protein